MTKTKICHDCKYWKGRVSYYTESDGHCFRYPKEVKRFGNSKACGELILKKDDDLIKRIRNSPTLNDAYKKMKRAEHEFTMLEILSREDFKND